MGGLVLYDRKRGREEIGRVIVTLRPTLILGVYDGWAVFFFLSSFDDDARRLRANCAQKKKMGPLSGGVKVVTLPLPLPATGRPEKEKGKKEGNQ